MIRVMNFLLADGRLQSGRLLSALCRLDTSLGMKHWFGWRACEAKLGVRRQAARALRILQLIPRRCIAPLSFFQKV